MSRQHRVRLVPPKIKFENQSLEILAEPNLPEQKEKPALSALDMEIECPRCNEIMELCSNFDELVYSCESCSFLLRRV
jgi:hypothetical protein